MNTTKSKLEVAVVKCFFCGRDKGLVMNTRLTEKDAKAIREAHNHAIDYEPCDECKKWMEQGIILVSIRDGESGNNPYRTGGFVVIKEDAVKEFSTPEMFEKVKKARFAFIEDSIWNALGLPRKEVA